MGRGAGVVDRTRGGRGPGGPGCPDWRYSADFNEKCGSVEYVIDFLARIGQGSPAALRRLQYIEQPMPRDLRAGGGERVDAAAKIKPVVIDESLVDYESLLLARELGYSGVALKACKGQSEALLMAAAAQKFGMFLCVQDLTCPGASFLHSASLAARIPGVAAIEGNARQYCPVANRGWAERFPTMFHITDGTVGTVRLADQDWDFSVASHTDCELCLGGTGSASASAGKWQSQRHFTLAKPVPPTNRPGFGLSMKHNAIVIFAIGFFDFRTRCGGGAASEPGGPTRGLRDLRRRVQGRGNAARLRPAAERPLPLPLYGAAGREEGDRGARRAQDGRRDGPLRSPQGPAEGAVGGDPRVPRRRQAAGGLANVLSCFRAPRKAKSPPGCDQWPGFDADVLGCRYVNHLSNDRGSDVANSPEAAGEPLLAGVRPPGYRGSLSWSRRRWPPTRRSS